MIPEINKKYNCFDDGKIRESRLYTVYITEVIEFSNIDSETLIKWGKLISECNWLYSEETDFFVKFKNGENNEDGVFVRTKDNGWFGMGDFWNCGRLDIDGSLVARLNKS